MTGKRVSQPRKSVWLSPPRARGRKGTESSSTGLDLDRIVAAAVRLLDAEGDAQFSMRRLAAELNVTPMSLYWYVANKDDLLELALDAVAGEIKLPDPGPDSDWREELRALATAWRRTMVAHPWAVRAYGAYLNIGPCSVRFTSCAQDIVARSSLPQHEHPAALSAVFQYVYGFISTETRWLEYARETGQTADEFFSEVADSVEEMPGERASGGLMEQHESLSMDELRDRDFDRALDWLIAGMCADAATARQPRQPAGR